jgi:glutamate 5-kinase
VLQLVINNYWEDFAVRIVIKVCTSTLTHKSGCVNIRRIESLCKIISDMMNAGDEVILVSSGAIGMGVGKLKLHERPKDIAGKQAAAAVGQCELMYIYDKEFTSHNHTVAQILLTAPDLECEDRHAKFRATMSRLIELGAIPIINENDTVATEEIEFGDNDTLAARVASSIGADLLVLLSDIDGLYTADPHKDPLAMLIPEVYEITPEIEALGGGAGTSLGTGGMVTKLRAAKIATEAGCDMIIANGTFPELLYNIMDGKAAGTRFFAKKD